MQFNIAIQDHPEVLAETKKALQISQTENIINRLPICVEISLQTSEGDKMILEVWSLNINQELSDPAVKAPYNIYTRMTILLKSLISITRITPAYKLSRRQTPDSYSIYYRIYSGDPQQHNLGKWSLSIFHSFSQIKTTTESMMSNHMKGNSINKNYRWEYFLLSILISTQGWMGKISCMQLDDYHFA